MQDKRSAELRELKAKIDVLVGVEKRDWCDVKVILCCKRLAMLLFQVYIETDEWDISTVYDVAEKFVNIPRVRKDGTIRDVQRFPLLWTRIHYHYPGQELSNYANRRNQPHIFRKKRRTSTGDSNFKNVRVL